MCENLIFQGVDWIVRQNGADMVAGQRGRVLVHHAWPFGRGSSSGRLPAHADGGHFVDGPNDQAV